MQVVTRVSESKQGLLFELPGLSSGLDSIEARFARFNRGNPEVLEALICLARERRAEGRSFCSMKKLYEDLRDDVRFRTSGGEGFKLNNSFTALYARRIMRVCPDLRGFFRLRGG